MAQDDLCLSTMLIPLITAGTVGVRALALGGPHS